MRLFYTLMKPRIILLKQSSSISANFAGARWRLLTPKQYLSACAMRRWRFAVFWIRNCVPLWERMRTSCLARITSSLTSPHKYNCSYPTPRPSICWHGEISFRHYSYDSCAAHMTSALISIHQHAAIFLHHHTSHHAHQSAENLPAHCRRPFRR